MNQDTPSPGDEQCRTGKRPSVRKRVACILAAVASVALLVYFLRNRQAAVRDAEDSFSTPYLNANTQVAYVGQHRCKECHPVESDKYARHPMGRSIFRIREDMESRVRRLPANLPVLALGFEYDVRASREKELHREVKRLSASPPMIEQEFEAAFAVGSGEAGRAYLIDREGSLFLSPLAWFPQKRVWGLSPGYEQTAFHPHFERPVTSHCLYCHADPVAANPACENRYAEPLALHAISCERCHGPGALHIESQLGAKAALKDTIVNPASLPPQLRDAVCEQCHVIAEQYVPLRGRRLEDYRPGLPLHLFQAMFFPAHDAQDDSRFGNRVEQMEASACHIRSAGKLGCISCHDPHYKPAEQEKVGFFRDRCLRCHGPGSKECSLGLRPRLRQSPQDDCAGCHMPRNPTNLIHVSLTNHRVARPGHPGEKRQVSAEKGALLPLHPHLFPLREHRREFSIANLRSRLSAQSPELREEAMAFLEGHLDQWPEDREAWETLGLAYLETKAPKKALHCFKTLLNQEPQPDRLLSYAAMAAAALGLNSEALDYLEKAAQANPYSSQHQVGIASLCMQNGELPRALAATRRALEINPVSPDARRLLVLLLVRIDNREEALKAYRVFAALDPPDKEQVRRLVEGSP